MDEEGLFMGKERPTASLCNEKFSASISLCFHTREEFCLPNSFSPYNTLIQNMTILNWVWMIAHVWLESKPD